MKLWLWWLDHFGKQDASKGVIYKVWVYLAGLRQAERRVWVLYKNNKSSESQTSDKATKKRFPAVGVAGSWHPNHHRLARWCAKVRRQERQANASHRSMSGPPEDVFNGTESNPSGVL